MNSKKQEKPLMTERKLMSIEPAIFLAVMTGFLYCAGMAYENAYLHALQLDPNLLELNPPQYLYSGLVHSLDTVATRVLFGFGIFFSWAFQILPFHEWALHRIPKYKQFIDWLINDWNSGLLPTDRLKEYERIARAWGFYLIFAFFLLAGMISIEKTGKAAGQAVADRIDKKSRAPNGVLSVEIDDKTVEVWKLQCSTDRCAGIDMLTGIVHYFPSDTLSFKYIPKQPEPKVLAPKPPEPEKSTSRPAALAASVPQPPVEVK